MFLIAYAGLKLHCGEDKQVNLLNFPYSFCECTAKYHVNVNDECVCKDENAFLQEDKSCLCIDQSKVLNESTGYCACKSVNYLKADPNSGDCICVDPMSTLNKTDGTCQCTDPNANVTETGTC